MPESQHPGPIPLSHHLIIPLRLSPTPYSAFTRPAAPRPKASSFSVPVSPLRHGILAMLHWPARGRTAGRRAASFRDTRTPGGFCLGSGYRAGPASRGRGLLLYFGAVRIGSGVLPESCIVEEMVFGELARGGELLARLFGSRLARCCVDFSDGSWDSRLGFSSLVWFLDGEKKLQCWDLFEMFDIFIFVF